eukprot:2006780-Ditylum_brightwellii.AAC.1
MQRCVAGLFGKLLPSIHSHLTEGETNALRETYKTWCRSRDAKIRELCAHNFTVMLRATGAR